MKKITYFLPLLSLLALVGCNNSGSINAKNAKALCDSLTKNLSITGHYSEEKQIDEDHTELVNSYDITKAYSEGRYFAVEGNNASVYYREDDQKKVCEEQLELDNTVSQKFLKLDFDDSLKNPFVGLKEEDFERKSNSFYLKNQSIQLRFVNNMLRQSIGELIPTFDFIVKGSKVEKLSIKYTSSNSTGVDTTKTMEFTFDNSITNAYTLEPSKGVKKYSLLKDSFNKVLKAKNYTFTETQYSKTESGDLNKVTESNLKVVENGFVDYLDVNNPTGVMKFSDGKYYKFNASSNSVTKGDEVTDYTTSTSKYRPSLSDISPKVFIQDKDDAFTLMEKTIRDKFCSAATRRNVNKATRLQIFIDKGLPEINVSEGSIIYRYTFSDLDKTTISDLTF